MMRSLRGKRRHSATTNDHGQVYENVQRKFKSDPQEDVEHLLPIKLSDGKILLQVGLSKSDSVASHNQSNNSKEIDDNETELANEDFCLKRVKQEPDELPCSSALSLYCERSKIIENFRYQIAALSTHIVENPVDHVNSLKDLLHIAQGSDHRLRSVQRLATLSLLEIYIDIIPAYRIRELTDEEKKQKMKKDTKRLQEFESSLVRNYKKFLQCLETFTKGPVSSDGASSSLVGVQCLCRLLLKHSHFNFHSNIIALLIPLMMHKNKEISEVCCSTVEQIFKEDVVGEISLEICRCIRKTVKTRQGFTLLTPRMLSTFLTLNIREINSADDQKSKHQQEKKLQKKKQRTLTMSRREKKRTKELAKVDKELSELNAENAHAAKLKYKTEIISSIFAFYFQILKECKKPALLGPVFEGLSKFAHLINIEFFNSLFVTLKKLLESKTLKTLDSLLCIHTVLMILDGQGSAIEIDPLFFCKSLYTILTAVPLENSRGIQQRQFSLCLKCMDLMIIRKKRQISVARVAAFAKRLVLLTFSLYDSEIIACLALLRTFFIAFPPLERLLDEESCGSGNYLPSVDDPEHCNALSAFLHELIVLQHHKNAAIRTYAASLVKYCQSSVTDKTFQFISDKSPSDLYKELCSREQDHLNLDRNNYNPAFEFLKHFKFKSKDDLDLLNKEIAKFVKELNSRSKLKT